MYRYPVSINGSKVYCMLFPFTKLVICSSNPPFVAPIHLIASAGSTTTRSNEPCFGWLGSEFTQDWCCKHQGSKPSLALFCPFRSSFPFLVLELLCFATFVSSRCETHTCRTRLAMEMFLSTLVVVVGQYCCTNKKNIGTIFYMITCSNLLLVTFSHIDMQLLWDWRPDSLKDSLVSGATQPIAIAYQYWKFIELPYWLGWLTRLCSLLCIGIFTGLYVCLRGCWTCS